MRADVREVISDWLMVAGGVGLLGSLFLTWSHQFSPAFLAVWGGSVLLNGVPHDPTAWQVYSVADVLLALLAVGLVLVAMWGARAVRTGALVAVGIALAFTIHALSAPPTNGANIFNPALSVPTYSPNSPGAGVGETVAIGALLVAAAGLGLSLASD